MQRTEILIYLLIIAVIVFLILKYWKTGRKE